MIVLLKKVAFVFFLTGSILFSGCQYFTGSNKLFRLLSSNKTGIHFNNEIEETHVMNIISYPDFFSGGGVAIGDIDNDGLPDIFFTGNQVPSKLYKNKGEMVFEDITATSNLNRKSRSWYTGTSMVDLNADGFLDIYICRSGMSAAEDRANLLYINNQDGTFTEKAKEYGLDNQGYGVNAYFFDYDKDGDIDVYVANQVAARLNSSAAKELRPVFDEFAGDKLYENIGNVFIDVSKESGIYSSMVGFAHGVAIGDVNDDGWEDLFVSNDFFEYDYLYLNNGDKTFTESLQKATRHISHFSMGNDVADYNNDGLLDIVVLDMVAEDNRRLYMNTGGNDQQRFDRVVQHGLHHQYMFNVLHLNNGNETFSEIGMLAGISRTDWSWAPLFADFDNDGFKDLYVTNGIRKDIRNIDWAFSYLNILQFVGDFTEFEASQWDLLLNSLPYEPIPNYMFRNNGDLTFSKVMSEWGLGQKSYSNGVAYGDLDRDGDLDLVVNNVDAEAFVYENINKKSNYLQFKFNGPPDNPMGLGTKVRIHQKDKIQYQQQYVSRGYRSSMEPIMHFGVGNDPLVFKVEVIWPDGRISIYNEIKSNQVVVLDYAESMAPEIIEDNPPEYLFNDITEDLEISIRHREKKMNDFAMEPMLPYKLSTSGPPLAVGDVNNDGLDDFYFGGALPYEGQLFIQTQEGKFKSSQIEFWKQEKMHEDVGATFLDIDSDGDQDLYVVSGGIEELRDMNLMRDRLYLNDGEGNFTSSSELIPEMSHIGSCVVPADFDNDGDVDLFLGGRRIHENYALPADSYLLRNSNGRLENVTNEEAPEFSGLGLVTDAVWSDYDGDNDLDLIVVGEWMSVTLFNNDSGKLKKVENRNNGLDNLSGWWWSIEASDIDNDGDDDYILGNMGLNYKFRASQKEPLELYIYDFDGNDRLDFIMGYHQEGHVYPTVTRAKAMIKNRELKMKMLSNNTYAFATLSEIYGKDKIKKATNKKIQTLASGFLENIGNGKFEFTPFDNYAQFSNVNSIVIEDIDKDGNKDLILAGNLYSMEAETIRNDASIGIWMKGDGAGHFKSIPFTESGLYLNGDVRALKQINTVYGSILLSANNSDYVQVIKVGK